VFVCVQSGLTPLHVAAFMGHMNVVLFLLQHGANPNSTTVRGETSLHLAARANQTDILRILLRNGAHVDAKARVSQVYSILDKSYTAFFSPPGGLYILPIFFLY